ncbi:MAG: DoxX family protein [Bacteroidota bacterium]
MEDVVKQTTEYMSYPVYFLSIIGIWKLLGVVAAILIPRYPLLKEWAHAGFFFNPTDAIISHMDMEDPIDEFLPATLLLVLITVSYSFGPTGHKLLTKSS